MRAFAARVAMEYEYPVDSLVLSSAGELLDHSSANESIEEARYAKLLDAAKR